MRRRLVVPVVILLVVVAPALMLFVPVETWEAHMMKKTTPPQEVAMVQTWIQWLREGNYSQIEQGIDPDLRTDDLKDKLDTMARLIPAEQPKSVKPIGYYVTYHSDSRTITTTLEYQFADYWLVATMVQEEQSDTTTVSGFHVWRIPESVEAHNKFRLLGKGPADYALLLLSLAALMVSAYGVIVSLRSSMGKRKWLWALVCLIGVGRLAINWTTGAVSFTLLWFGFPPSGAEMNPLYSPWVVYSSLPVGAVLFLVLKDRLTRVTPTPEPQQVSPSNYATPAS